jgi:branched-chain amino acid transport system permease protein
LNVVSLGNFIEVLSGGLLAGVLYSLVALGFVLIFKASGVFNFAQGIMVVFAALTLVGLYNMLRKWGVRPGDLAAFLALGITVVVMLILAWCVERLVLRPLVNQDDIILFMATFGLTYFLIGFGQLVFGGEPKVMIAEDLYLPKGSYDVKMLGGYVQFQKIDIAAAVIASVMVGTLAIFFQKTRIGRALRAVADSHKAALSVGISLEQIWVIVWFAAGIVAITTGIMWGAKSQVEFGIGVAERGLWREAIYRWEKAVEIDVKLVRGVFGSQRIFIPISLGSLSLLRWLQV